MPYKPVVKTENDYEFTFFINGKVEKMPYSKYLDNHDLRAEVWDKKYLCPPGMEVFVCGRFIFLITEEWLKEKASDGQRHWIGGLWEHAVTCPIAHFAPASEEALAFLNDDKNDCLMMIGPNGVGKTATAIIRMLIGSIPMNPEWNIFSLYGVRYRPFVKPLKLGVGTYNWQLQKNKIWPDIQRWIPDAELGPYAENYPDKGRKDVSWDRNARMRCMNRTQIQFYVYDQPQGLFESDGMHKFLWDEQAPEARFDGVDERLRRLHGEHIFSLTPHKIDGYPETGRGSWVHEMVTGKNRRGHTIGEYTIDVPDVQDWIYPEDGKVKAFQKWIEVPKRIGNTKVLREGMARFYGKWHSSSGVIFDEWSRDTHLIDPLWTDPPAEATLYREVDYGYVHPEACLWFAVLKDKEDGRPMVFVYRGYYEKNRTIYQNAAAIVEASGNSLRPGPTFSDPRTGVMFKRYTEIQVKERYIKTELDSRSFTQKQEGRDIGWLHTVAGLKVTPANGKHPVNSIPFAKDALKPDMERLHVITRKPGGPSIYVFNVPSLRPLVHEIENYVWDEPKTKQGRIDGNPRETPRKKDDHGVSCLLQGIMCPLRYVGPHGATGHGREGRGSSGQGRSNRTVRTRRTGY